MLLFLADFDTPKHQAKVDEWLEYCRGSRFLMCLSMLCDILPSISHLSRMFQTSDLTIDGAHAGVVQFLDVMNKVHMFQV